MSKNDGGSAFPHTEIDSAGDIYQQHFGMTLRDYFAAHAPRTRDAMSLEEHVAYRYRYADAMLKARGA